MDDRQLFKFAFLMEAARDGLTPAEALALARDLESEAREKRAGVGGMALKTLGLLKGLGLGGVGMAVGGAAALGGGAGYTLAKLREGNFDADAAKKQELIAAYNTFADQVRASNASRRRATPGVRLAIE